MFQKFYFNIFNAYKARHKQRAKSIALVYVSFLEISLVLFLGVFLTIFLKQMYVNTMSSENAWILFTMVSLGIYVKNWFQYSGKNLNIMRAKLKKSNSQDHSVWLLWLLPLAMVALSILMLQSKF